MTITDINNILFTLCVWAVSHAAGIAAFIVLCLQGGLIICRIRRERLEIRKLEKAEEDKEDRDGGQPRY